MRLIIKLLVLIPAFLFMLNISYAYTPVGRCVVKIVGKVSSLKERREDRLQENGRFGSVIIMDMRIEIKRIEKVVKDSSDPAVNCEDIYKVGKKIDVSLEKTPTFLMDTNGSILPGSIITGNLESADESYGAAYSLTNVQLME